MALGKIQSIAEGGIDDTEVASLENAVAEMLEQHPEAINSTEIQKAIKILENALKDGVNTTDDTRTKVGKMRDSLHREINETNENLSTGKNFSHLKEEFGTYIATGNSMDFFQNQFNGIIDEKAPHITLEVRDMMMLSAWRGWIKNIDDVGALAGEGVAYMMSLGSEGKQVEEGSRKDLIGDMFQEIEDFVIRVDTTMREAKSKGVKDIDFTHPNIIGAISEGENNLQILASIDTASNTYYEETQKITQDFIVKIKDMDASFAGIIEKLGGEDFGKKLGQFAKENPWFGVILSILGLGDLLEGFVDGSEKKRMQSLAQLTTLSSTDNSPISNLVPENFFQDFDTKKLNPFFKYLSAQKIDFTHEKFWENLLSGNTKDSKINSIHQVLGDESGVIFVQADFKDGGKGMVEKLNSLPKLEQQRKQDKRISQKSRLAAALPVIVGIAGAGRTPTDTTFETEITQSPEEKNKNRVAIIEDNGDAPTVKEAELTKKQEAPSPHPLEEKASIDEPSDTSQTMALVPEADEKTKEQYTEYRNMEILEAIINAKQFPITLTYEKTAQYKILGINAPKTLDFKNGGLVIDNIPYVTSFSNAKHEYATVEGIVFDGAKISESSIDISVTAVGTYFVKLTKQGIFSLPKEEFSELVLEIIDTNQTTQEIPKINGITGGTYTLSKS